jgi:hypothetical protein
VIIRFALFGTHASVDETRDAAVPVFGDIFVGYTNDYSGGYWLGHWHIPDGESKWYGDAVKIITNIYVDEDGTKPRERDHPDWPTLLYLTGSDPEIERTLQDQGFALLSIDEV